MAIKMYKLKKNLKNNTLLFEQLITRSKLSGPEDFEFTRPQGYKTFFMLNSTEHKNSAAHKKLNYRQMKKFLVLRLSDVAFIMLINVKMSTIVGILPFMSRINFVLS